MLLTEYLSGQFSLIQNLEFFARIAAACVCGGFIGFERSKRYKEAGIRTHIIVCCAAALLMIVSKYGFADLTDPAGAIFNGTRGADPARIAAQVISGIGFLGAGVIFKHGGTIKGLTTAAGLWTTAGIGLALGAGMYAMGIFTTALLAGLQLLTHKFVVGADSFYNRHVQFTICAGEQFQDTLDGFFLEQGIRILECAITYHDDGSVSYDMKVRMTRDLTTRELDRFLRDHGHVRFVSCSASL